MTRTLQWLGVLLCSVVLAACATSASEKKVDFNFIIKAEKDINPDIKGEPSSVVVQIYQLSGSGNFEAAQYEDLFNTDARMLANEFIGVDKYLIDPDSKQTFETEISARTKFIGVAVGYREIEFITWKVVQPIAEDTLLDTINVFADKGMAISIDARNVRIRAN